MRLLLLLCLVGVVQAQQQWNAQNFPNPTRGQFKECGMLTTSNICDPDGVLDVASRNRLDYELKQLERRTSQDRGRNFCEKKGVTPAMAIAKRVQGGQQQDVKNMANNMLRTWDLDQQCKKSIVIVVSFDDQKFWVARDDKVPVYAQEFTQIFEKNAPLLKKKQYTDALNGILQNTWEKALAKQGSPQTPTSNVGGGGKQQPSPGFGDTGGRGGGKGFNIPSWVWLAVIFVVIPLLCCCCCVYCCCCRGKGAGSAPAGRQPVPQDYPAGGGGGGPYPSNPSGPTGGGGRFGNFMSTLGGAGAGSMIGNFLSNRNRGGGGGGGMGMGGMGGMGSGAYGGSDYQGGGAYPAPPQPVVDDNGEGGKGLYPSISVKDEGGGGSWA